MNVDTAEIVFSIFDFRIHSPQPAGWKVEETTTLPFPFRERISPSWNFGTGSSRPLEHREASHIHFQIFRFSGDFCFKELLFWFKLSSVWNVHSFSKEQIYVESHDSMENNSLVTLKMKGSRVQHSKTSPAGRTDPWTWGSNSPSNLLRGSIVKVPFNVWWKHAHFFIHSPENSKKLPGKL